MTSCLNKYYFDVSGVEDTKFFFFLIFWNRKNCSCKDFYYLLLFHFIKFFFRHKFFWNVFCLNSHIFFYLCWWKFFLHLIWIRNSLFNSIYFIQQHQQFIEPWMVEQILLMLKKIFVNFFNITHICKVMYVITHVFNVIKSMCNYMII